MGGQETGGHETLRSEDWLPIELEVEQPDAEQPDAERLRAEIASLLEQLKACTSAWRETLFQLSLAHDEIGALEAKPPPRHTRAGGTIAPISEDTWGNLQTAPSVQQKTPPT